MKPDARDQILVASMRAIYGMRKAIRVAPLKAGDPLAMRRAKRHVLAALIAWALSAAALLITLATINR
jgi:hypothetical protein